MVQLQVPFIIPIVPVPVEFQYLHGAITGRKYRADQVGACKFQYLHGAITGNYLPVKWGLKEYFNTYMVQLQVITTLHTEPLEIEYFNTYMVQLQVSGRKVLSEPQGNFNTYMVQLQVKVAYPKIT